MYHLIIIGGGPAGITAGIYAARKKLNTLLITKDFIGQAGKAWRIENYPGFEEISGFELMAKLKKQLDKFALDIKEGEGVREIKKERDFFEVQTTEKNKYLARAVIIASGRDPRPLEVPGEKEFLGRGVSYCLTCEEPVFLGKTVAVIGGGNAGFMAGLELSKHCPKIYLLEAGIKPNADEIIQERVKESGRVEVICQAEVKEIRGTDFVSALVYRDKSLGKDIELPVQSILVEIGSVPATSFIKGLVDFNDRDEIRIDFLTNATKTAGLFAAGDVTEVKYKQIIVAGGEGAKAALSAYEYLAATEREK